MGRALAKPASLRAIDGFLKRSTHPKNSARRANQKNLSSPFAKNISLSPSGKSPVEARPIPAREEGRIAIVTDVGQGMRWTRQRRRAKGVAGRAVIGLCDVKPPADERRYIPLGRDFGGGGPSIDTIGG